MVVNNEKMVDDWWAGWVVGWLVWADPQNHTQQTKQTKGNKTHTLSIIAVEVLTSFSSRAASHSSEDMVLFTLYVAYYVGLSERG